MSDQTKVGARVEFGGVVFGFLNPTTLRPNPMNYTVHTDRQKSAIADSISEHGWVGFPIFNTQTGRLVDGHARVEEARRRGDEGVVCVLVHMDEGQEKRLLASYNRVAQLAGTDDAMLARLLQDCAAEGPMPAGWEEEELGTLLLRVNRDTLRPTRERRTEPRLPADLEEDEDGEEGGDPALRAATAGNVKTVQLFYPPEGEREFLTLVDDLKNRWETRSASETVLAALRMARGEAT